jgi:magnesium-transporting ATPase (P-type)
MTNVFLNYLIAGTLGVLLQIFAVKYPSIVARGKKGNHKVTFKEYLENDWWTIIASFIGVLILIFCIDELLNISPALGKYIKWLFVFVGFTGSSIVQAVLSVTNRKVMQIIDLKSNLADGVVPPVNEDNWEGAVEILKEKDIRNFN